MTLIYSRLGDGLLTISDVLVSLPAAFGEQLVALPFHIEPLSHLSGEWALAGVRQKMILAKNALILWSGSVLIARTIIAEGLEASRGGQEFLDFPVFLEGLGLTEAELADVGIIYHFFGPEGILRYCHNTEMLRSGADQIAYSGSGGWDFVVDTTIEKTNTAKASREQHVGDIYRCIVTLIREGWTKNNYDYLYGGWFEVAFDEAGITRKIPYAIKFWSVGKRGLRADLPLFFSFYDDDDLVVCRADVSQGRAQVGVHLIEPPHRHNPDKIKPASIRWEPKFVCHVVLQEGTDGVSLYMRFEMSTEMAVEIDPETGKMSNQFSQQLINMLQGVPNADVPSFSFEKPSEP
jgi:hypothetical protein